MTVSEFCWNLDKIGGSVRGLLYLSHKCRVPVETMREVRDEAVKRGFVVRVDSDNPFVPDYELTDLGTTLGMISEVVLGEQNEAALCD